MRMAFCRIRSKVKENFNGIATNKIVNMSASFILINITFTKSSCIYFFYHSIKEILLNLKADNDARNVLQLMQKYSGVKSPDR